MVACPISGAVSGVVLMLLGTQPLGDGPTAPVATPRVAIMPRPITAPARFDLPRGFDASGPMTAAPVRVSHHALPSIPARRSAPIRYSPAGAAMGMAWDDSITNVDNDRFEMRTMRIDKITGSKIKGPLDAGLMLRITASTRSMNADVGLTGGPRVLSDALMER